MTQRRTLRAAAHSSLEIFVSLRTAASLATPSVLSRSSSRFRKVALDFVRPSPTDDEHLLISRVQLEALVAADRWEAAEALVLKARKEGEKATAAAEGKAGSIMAAAEKKVAERMAWEEAARKKRRERERLDSVQPCRTQDTCLMRRSRLLTSASTGT